MTIKRKDGSVYRLRGPNPIMLNQSLWDGKIIVHDINPKEIVTKEGYDNPPVEPAEHIPLEEIEVEEIEVPIIEPPAPPPQQKRIVPKEVEKEMVYVLPASVKETYDSLYDETRKQIVYGTKFTMEVVIIEQNDLQLSFWTNSANPENASIVYIPRGRRWWKVAGAVAKNEGHVITCNPSDIYPSFD